MRSKKLSDPPYAAWIKGVNRPVILMLTVQPRHSKACSHAGFANEADEDSVSMKPMVSSQGVPSPAACLQ